jgi:hypothetical protein
MFALCICWYKKYIRYRYNSLHKYMWIYIYLFIFLHTWHHITSHHNAVHNIMLHMYHNVCTGCMDIICVHYNIKCICTVEININIYIYTYVTYVHVCVSFGNHISACLWHAQPQAQFKSSLWSHRHCPHHRGEKIMSTRNSVAGNEFAWRAPNQKSQEFWT